MKKNQKSETNIVAVVSSPIWQKAEQFFDAAELLYERFKDFDKQSPFIVNAALALELYLKALCAEESYQDLMPIGDSQIQSISASPVVQCHKLTRLWDKIPDDTKKIGRKIYQGCPLINKYPMITDALKAYNDIFESERYSFEKFEQKLLNSGDLKKLMCFVKEFVLRVHHNNIGMNKIFRLT